MKKLMFNKHYNIELSSTIKISIFTDVIWKYKGHIINV